MFKDDAGVAFGLNERAGPSIVRILGGKSMPSPKTGVSAKILQSELPRFCSHKENLRYWHTKLT